MDYIIETHDTFILIYAKEFLPSCVEQILALGPTLTIPPLKFEISIQTIIHDSEYTMKNSQNDVQDKNILRARITNIFTNY